MNCRIAAASCLLFGLIATPRVEAQLNLVDHLTMNQWVQSQSDGSFHGRVVLPRGEGQAAVGIAMSGRDGEVLRATSDENGEFTISDVKPGVYAFTARGADVFACCAMHVIGFSEGEESRFPSSAEIRLANVDYTVVNTAVIRYMPPKARTNFTFDAELDSLASRVCGQDLFRVAQIDGGMKGQIHLAGASGAQLAGANLTNVFVYNDGLEVQRTVTNESGRFVVENLLPGRYSLLAIGAGGVGLIGFELVDASRPSPSNSDGKRLIGIQGYGCCEEFAMQIAPMPEIVSCVEEVVVVEEVIADAEMEHVEIIEEFVCDDCFAPLPGCGTCDGNTGFYGGGGGGGGYGGGDLGGLAALAAIAAIAASNNDDNNVPPVIASPAIPN